MRTNSLNNFEAITKRNSIINDSGNEWADRKDNMKKRHAKLNKTQRGVSHKRSWTEVV